MDSNLDLLTVIDSLKKDIDAQKKNTLIITGAVGGVDFIFFTAIIVLFILIKKMRSNPQQPIENENVPMDAEMHQRIPYSGEEMRRKMMGAANPLSRNMGRTEESEDYAFINQSSASNLMNQPSSSHFMNHHPPSNFTTHPPPSNAMGHMSPSNIMSHQSPFSFPSQKSPTNFLSQQVPSNAANPLSPSNFPSHPPPPIPPAQPSPSTGRFAFSGATSAGMYLPRYFGDK